MIRFIILLTILKLAYSAEWDDNTYKCKFKMDYRNHYSCLLSHTGLSGYDVKSGEHIEGKTKNDVEAIFFSWMVIDIPRDFLVHFSNIKYVKISHMTIKKLEGKQFEKSEKVEEFNGSFNDIEEVGANAFDFVPNLKILTLHKCHIKKINLEAFKGLELLESLDISNNQIENLQVGMFDSLPNLSLIDAGVNPITSLQSGLFKNNKHLRVVNFYKAPIKHIDLEFIRQLPAGTFLRLEQTQCIHTSFSIRDLEYSLGRKEQEEFIETIRNNCTNTEMN